MVNGTKITPEDQAFNIMFVAEVKSHPCLFDSSCPEYKQIALQDRAWQAVSELVGEGVDTCKKRWRNLRCCMTRYLKSLRDNNEVSSTARRKPYYLYNHMQFVLPHLKVRDESITFEQEDTPWAKNGESEVMIKSDVQDGEDAADDNDDDDDDEEDLEDERPEIETVTLPVQETNSQQIKDSIMQSIKILPITPESHTAQTSQSQQHTALSPPSESLSATTTTFEIITNPPVKQPRLSQANDDPNSSANTNQLQSPDGKRDAHNQRQFFAFTSTPMHSSSIPLSCYPSTMTPVQQQQQQQTFSQQQYQTQTSAPHFTLIPGTTQSVVNDADHNFFQSLVPDIQTMTMEQKRKLRIGILQLIDNILNT